jgi:primary-amine oxidase
MTPSIACRFLCILTLVGLHAVRASAASPLDPLSAKEIATAVQLIKTDPRLAGAAFPLVSLAEPPKADVLAWTPASGKPMARHAYAVVMTAKGTFEVRVDLQAKRLISVVERPDAEAPITMSEVESVGLVLDNPEFQDGLKKRGITNFKQLFCAPWTAGNYGIPEYEGKRIVKVGCFDTRKTTTNLFGWPIERLYAIVDLRERKVLSVRDDGVVPIAEGDRNYTEATVRQVVGRLRAPRKPTLLAQPQGSNIRIDGHDIAWGNWRFHARIDGRVGTVISLVRWLDTQAQPQQSRQSQQAQQKPALRSILYEGYLSEMFVPYMDADYGWYSRTFLDTGEYGAGLLATPLKPGIDCPATARFLPAVLNDDKGQPFTTPNALCLFERSTGAPIWRHSEVINHTYEGRANTELVVRMASTIGNYDYIFDWVFNDAAEIEVRVGATGIDALKGVASRTMTDASAAADTRYGTLVAPNLVAVNHDHYFNFRLDLDVDGPANSFIHDTYTPVTLPPDSPRRSLYVVEPHIAMTEKNAQLDTHGHAPARFRVANESKKNAVGNPVSYDVAIANHAQLLLDPQDSPAKRAQFLQHDIWVTPFDPAERHAAGEMVYESRGGGGLPAWTAKDRAIRDRDIVIWVNLGMHHLTRAEDLPVMPTVWHSFILRPHNFFDRSPAIDLPSGTPTAPPRAAKPQPTTQP